MVEGLGKKDERSFFFTNIKINDLGECHKIVKKYSKRWSCEEAIRFVKQGFRIEDVRVQSYLALQRMLLFCMLAYSFLCLFIEIWSIKNKRLFHWLKILIKPMAKQIYFYNYRILESMQKILNLDFFDNLRLE